MADAPVPGPRSEADLLADPQLRELLAGYQPMFHESFLRAYGRVLADLYHNGEYYENNLEYLLHQHDKEAYKYLWLIQHQKLFDLECQWRAGLVAVPQARITADFEDWHEFIEECTVISPISPDELDLLLAFLHQLADPAELSTGNPSHTFWLQKRYPHMRYDPDDPDSDNDDPLTDWTQYWDVHRGTGYLRQLPDVRGEAEFRYEKAAQAEHRRTHPYTPPPADARPHVPTWGDEYEALIRDWLRRFEPAARLRQYETKQQLEAYDANEDRDDLRVALGRLQNAGPVLVPIEAHADWRQAIIAASHRHYLSQLAAALPYVYEAYCQRQDLGISHVPANEHHRQERGTYFAHHQEQIREGRRLLGEPDDLDY